MGPCQASYKIDGYSFGSSLEEAVNATTSAEAPTFTGQLQNQSVIIWNSLCEFNDEEDGGGDGDGNGDDDTDPDPEDTDGGGSSGSSSGGQSGSRIKNNGDVLGASTEAGDVLGASTCSEEYLSSYIKYGAQNDPVEVTKLQAFLNKYINAGLALNGFYGDETRSAVNAFQRTQSAFVLQPWVDAGLMENIDTPTGYVYKTTRRWINILECPSLMPVLPVPQLP